MISIYSFVTQSNCFPFPFKNQLNPSKKLWWVFWFIPEHFYVFLNWILCLATVTFFFLALEEVKKNQVFDKLGITSLKFVNFLVWVSFFKLLLNFCLLFCSLFFYFPFCHKSTMCLPKCDKNNEIKQAL